MKRTIGWMAMTAALLVAPSMAQAGFTMGARLGLGIPGGEQDGVSGIDLADDVARSTSFMFHLGGAFAQNHASIEGFMEFSSMTPADDWESFCDVYDCSIVGMRIGVMGTFRFMPEQFVSPWVGAGLGWEMLAEDFEGNTYIYTGTTFELMGGLDFKAGPVFSWGPYVSMQFGTYADVEADDYTGTYSYDPDSGMHTWMQIGIRGKFDFGGGGGGGAYAPGPGY